MAQPHYTDPFRSARLVYRAIDLTDDEAFFMSMRQDPTIFVNASASMPRPQSKEDVQKYMKIVAGSICGVVICLPAPDATSKPIPIGSIDLQHQGDRVVHHRYTEIGVEIAGQYRGQGYGSEAIYWILEWAFERAGFHKVGVTCFGWNEGARRLYERLGFKLEGINRELMWYRNKWWDDISFGMLDREWADIKAKREKVES